MSLHIVSRLLGQAVAERTARQIECPRSGGHEHHHSARTHRRPRRHPARHPIRFGQDKEARLVDALRDGGHLRVSLIAEQTGQIVGYILFSDLPIITGAGTVPALALAPMAVLPELQYQGIGSALVRSGLEACRQQGHRIAVVLGHSHVYPRFGFSPNLTAQPESPFSGSDSFMAVELVPGALDGVKGRVPYPPPFGAWV
jgi:putative acetyltransferase